MQSLKQPLVPNAASQLCRHNTTRQSVSGAFRRAFSLIELMVVIVIIAILMSLLLVGVRGAMRTAQNARVTVEFKNLEAGIVAFKAKYGAEPPSGILLIETPADWFPPVPGSGASAAVKKHYADVTRSRALIRQIWPDFDFTIARDINGDTDTVDEHTLNGAECLVFFLGGVPTPTTDPNAPWLLTGFSSNGANPFVRGGARNGPFYEFATSQLMNFEGSADAENLPEYHDSLPGQTRPILYASSYGGKGYRNADLQLTSQADYDRYSTARTGFAWYYRRATGGATTPLTVTEFGTAEAFNPRSYQLISPGVDGEYGLGGVLSVDMEMVEAIRSDSPFPLTWPEYNNSARTFERDNITNFKGGTLN